MFARRIDREAGLAKHRLEALVDGVAAFALTILVLDLRVPGGLHVDDLPAQLWNLRAPAFTFLASVAAIGSFWLGHVQQMNFVTRLDRTLVWINVIGLGIVALLPFSTALLGDYLGAPLPTAIYGANVGFLGVIGLLHWGWATRGRHLLRPDTPTEAVRDLFLRMLIGVGLAAVGILVAFVSPWAAIALYTAAFIPFVLRGKHDDFLRPH